MKTPDDHRPDDLSNLFADLRNAPAAADPARVAAGLETRVLARVHEAAPSSDALRWFWRWSPVFGTAAVVCAALAIQNYNALSDDSFAALEGGVTLLDWFY